MPYLLLHHFHRILAAELSVFRQIGLDDIGYDEDFVYETISTNFHI